MNKPDSRFTIEQIFWFFRKKIALAFRPCIFSINLHIYIYIQVVMDIITQVHDGNCHMIASYCWFTLDNYI